MLTRDEALNLIDEHVANKNIVKHSLALEALMGGVYEELKSRGRSDEELGGTKEEWEMAGLLHDGDYCEGVPAEKHGIQVTEWAKQKGLAVPENVAYAMAAHNWHGNGTEPKTLMDWTIFMGDSLTGLIVATCLVLPSKKLAEVTPEMVLRRFKEPKFAAGTRREDVAMCQEKIGLSLEEFVKISLESMQKISGQIGL
ncbi:MAG TPA: phosphohydrolase [Patescibacteria group bacterium]|nr:phosphohydrolase [Patescibacteria group bacterium]